MCVCVFVRLVSMCDLLNLTKFISFTADFCIPASHNCAELIEFRSPSHSSMFLIFCGALKFNTFLFVIHSF